MWLAERVWLVERAWLAVLRFETASEWVGLLPHPAAFTGRCGLEREVLMGGGGLVGGAGGGAMVVVLSRGDFLVVKLRGRV